MCNNPKTLKVLTFASSLQPIGQPSRFLCIITSLFLIGEFLIGEFLKSKENKHMLGNSNRE